MSRTLSNLQCIPRLFAVWSRPLHCGGLSRVCVWHGDQDRNYLYCSHKPLHSLCWGHQSSAWHGQEEKSGLLLSPNMLSFCQIRGKAKGKAKGKHEKKSKPTKQDADDDDDDADPLKKFKGQLQYQFNHLKEQYLTQLGLRTNLNSYESLPVIIDKSQTVALNQLAQIIQKSPQLVQINMDASPQYLKEIKAALMNSGLNVNPQQEGTSLFINIPKVTREHRENLAKNAQKLYNDAKQQMNQFQSKQLKKGKGSGSDIEDETRTLYEEYTKKAEDMMKKKQKDLLG